MIEERKGVLITLPKIFFLLGCVYQRNVHPNKGDGMVSPISQEAAVNALYSTAKSYEKVAKAAAGKVSGLWFSCHKDQQLVVSDKPNVFVRLFRWLSERC